MAPVSLFFAAFIALAAIFRRLNKIKSDSLFISVSANQ
jgi:hypothetical protein